jgi:hypothetical protein
MIVYAIDERFPLTRFMAWRAIKRKHQASGTIYAVVDPEIKPADDMTVIVERIKEAVRQKGQGERSIWLLRLCAHGYAGHLELGKGMAWHNTKSWAGAWKKLAPWMTPGGRGVEIWGCGVASETDVREVGSKTASGRSEFRPGTVPKAFVRQERWKNNYRRGPQVGRLGGLGAPRPCRGQSTLQMVLALSSALGVQVRAPIHAQPPGVGFTELHGPSVTVHSTPNFTNMKLTLRPVDRATVRGPLGLH